MIFEHLLEHAIKIKIVVDSKSVHRLELIRENKTSCATVTLDDSHSQAWASLFLGGVLHSWLDLVLLFLNSNREDVKVLNIYSVVPTTKTTSELTRCRWQQTF
jgi:hypothetical protein